VVHHNACFRAADSARRGPRVRGSWELVDPAQRSPAVFGRARPIGHCALGDRQRMGVRGVVRPPPLRGNTAKCGTAHQGPSNNRRGRGEYRRWGPDPGLGSHHRVREPRIPSNASGHEPRRPARHGRLGVLASVPRVVPRRPSGSSGSVRRSACSTRPVRSDTRPS